MSLLNSILDSIGGDGNPAPASSTTSRAPPLIPKRKAEEQLTNGPAKRPVTPNNVQISAARRPPAPPTASVAAGYKGSARPAGTNTVPKPVPRPQAGPPPTASVIKPVSKPVGPTPTPTAAAIDKPAPKKGSYAEILARAKAAKETNKVAGVITHSKTEKLKKERLAEAAKGKNVPIRDKKQQLSDRSRTGSAEAVLKPGLSAKDKRKPVESTYKGTMKPAVVSTYKGTAGMGRPGPGGKPQREKVGKYGGYASWSDEDAEDEEEEEGYGSDGSSDMEAGAFDIDNEEELALRAAKVEDAKELALETQLKRQKMERLQKLEKLAAAKKKPGSGY